MSIFLTHAKALATALALIAASPVALARGHGGHGGFSRSYSCPGCNSNDHRVSGYTRRDGSRVDSYMQSDRNGTHADNFDHKGNVNPYTGKPGDRD